MDLAGATFSRFVSNQVCSVLKQLCGCAVAVGISLCVDVIVKSSAYDIMFMLAGVGGVSCMQMLKSVGDRTEPWGTPLGKFLVSDDLPLNNMCDYLPPKQQASHHLVLLCMFVLYSLSVSLCRSMASKALLMSTVIKSVLCADLFELMPSKTCVRLVSMVFVECTGRNSCCVGARGHQG